MLIDIHVYGKLQKATILRENEPDHPPGSEYVEVVFHDGAFFRR